jgi:hypothetical protein
MFPARNFRVRFSLRLLMVTTAIAAVGLGMWAERARRQRAGVEWVRSVGGRVTYDFEWDPYDGSYLKGGKPPGPKWVHDLLGIDYFANVDAVVLDRDEITDLSPLEKFPDLKVLGLMNFVHPETDLSPILSLKHLKELHLDYSGLDPEQLEPIRAAMPNVRLMSNQYPDLSP